MHVVVMSGISSRITTACVNIIAINNDCYKYIIDDKTNRNDWGV
jgi:hypothetical protein